MYPINQLIQYPSGRWGFIGRVDGRLAYTHKDGRLIDDASFLDKLSKVNNPALLAKGRSFATRQEAIDAARSLGLEWMPEPNHNSAERET